MLLYINKWKTQLRWLCLEILLPFGKFDLLTIRIHLLLMTIDGDDNKQHPMIIWIVQYDECNM